MTAKKDRASAGGGRLGEQHPSMQVGARFVLVHPSHKTPSRPAGYRAEDGHWPREGPRAI